MKNVISILLILSIATIFLPCLGMEKEKPLSQTDIMLFNATESNDIWQMKNALKQGAQINAKDPENNNETAWQKAIKNNAINSLNILMNIDFYQPLYIHNKHQVCPLFYFTAQTDPEKFNMIGVLAMYDIVASVFNRLKKHDPSLTRKKVSELYPSFEQILEFYNKTCETQNPIYDSYLCDSFVITLRNFCYLNEDSAVLVETYDIKLKEDSLESAQKQLDYYLDFFKIIIYESSKFITKKIGINPTIYEKFKYDINKFPQLKLVAKVFATISDIIDNQEKYNVEIEKRSELVKTTVKIKYMYQYSMANLVELLYQANKYHIQLKGSDDFESQKQDLINFMYPNDKTKSRIPKEQISIALTPILLLRSQKIKD